VARLASILEEAANNQLRMYHVNVLEPYAACRHMSNKLAVPISASRSIIKCRNDFPLANANYGLSWALLKLPVLRMTVSEQTKLVLVFFNLFCCHRVGLEHSCIGSTHEYEVSPGT